MAEVFEMRMVDCAACGRDVGITSKTEEFASCSACGHRFSIERRKAPARRKNRKNRKKK